MKKFFFALTAIISLGILAGIYKYQHHTPQIDNSQWRTLRIGYMPIAAELPLFVAINNGYFRDAGISYNLERFISSNEMANAATANRIDILAGAATNVIVDVAAVSGKHHRMFATNPYSNRPGHVTDRLLVRKQSDINSIEALKGKTIASLPGSVTVLVYLVLEKHGLQRSSYTHRELLPKDWATALANGNVDAVVALEPNASQMIRDNIGRPILSGFYAELMQDMPLSGHWFADECLKDAPPQQLAAVLSAYTRAIDFIRKNPEAAKMILPAYTPIKNDILGDVNLNPWKIGTEINQATIQQYMDILNANHATKPGPDSQDIVYITPKT